jgi:hypothetical protein
METFINVVVATTGIWLVIMSQLMHTENLRSALLFRAIPMFLGLMCIFSALVLFGIIPQS